MPLRLRLGAAGRRGLLAPLLGRRPFGTGAEHGGAAARLWRYILERHGPSAIVASPGFNRWLVPPAAIAFHLCLGGVYSWSLFNAPLTKVLGVVGSAAADWTLSSVVPVFSTAIFFLGASSALVGGHAEKVGPRLFGLAAAGLWSGGFLVASLGVSWHCLPLVYLGYGVLGGIGLGLGYLAPVGLLMSWFPERRGMATGMAIMGFGGGAVVAAPATDWLLAWFRSAPTRLAALDAPGQTISAGVRFLELQGASHEVLAASSRDLAAFPGLEEGLYLVGSGSVGLSEAFACFGATYLLIMATSALAWRIPAPAGALAVPDAGGSRVLPTAAAPALPPGVPAELATRSLQFALLWCTLGLNVTAGIGMIGVAKDMMTDIFSVLPVVTPEFARGYVMAVSLANMGGRFFWAAVSDHIGRKNAYTTYFALGVPLYLALPACASMVASEPSLLPLVLFYASTMVTFSTYGAGFSTMPAYVADTFGQRSVSAIFGKVLTAWSVAGIAGPLAITTLRARAERHAIAELAAAVDESAFQHAFQAPSSELDALVQSRAVTVAKLLALAPAGTLDPTPGMYNEVMVAMAGVQALALLANGLMRRHPDADKVFPK